jgi:hypothetical protein
VIAFTNRGELVCSVFTELVRHCTEADPGIVLGVGSIFYFSESVAVSAGIEVSIGMTVECSVSVD